MISPILCKKVVVVEAGAGVFTAVTTDPVTEPAGVSVASGSAAATATATAPAVVLITSAAIAAAVASIIGSPFEAIGIMASFMAWLAMLDATS